MIWKFDEIVKILRILAKSNYYQLIYSQEKNIGLRLFQNDTDLTKIQSEFLRQLQFYSVLYLDYALGEINEKVFENDVYEDAYMYYKRKKSKEEDEKEDIKEKNKKSKKVSWVFARPNRKK